MKVWSTSSFDGNTIPYWVEENYLALKPYVTEFLTSNHPHRNGAMCPFMPKALSDGMVYFTYFDGVSIGQAKRLIKSCLKFFEKNIGRKHGTVIIIFKKDFPIHNLLKIHIQSKEMCIKKYVMLGALFENSSAPSLHSDSYFPLRTPMPTLVMRDLTSSDLIFLEPDHHSSSAKYKFLSAFIKRFEDNESSVFTNKKVQKAKQLRTKYSDKSAAILACALLMCLMIIILIMAQE